MEEDKIPPRGLIAPLGHIAITTKPITETYTITMLLLTETCVQAGGMYHPTMRCSPRYTTPWMPRMSEER